MMTIPKHLPLTAEDPRYKQILLKGARETFEIPCADPSQAHQLQAILCTFRSRMKRERPDEREEWEPLYQCVVSKKKSDPSVLILYPRTSQFDNVLDKIPGISPPTLSRDPLEGLEED